MNDNVVPLRKDGVPVVPLCKDCEHFHGTMGIGSSPMCGAPLRKGSFNPVYGWRMSYRDAFDARNSNDDCGMSGKWYEDKHKAPLLDSEKPRKSWWRKILKR